MEKQFDIGMTTREMLDTASGVLLAAEHTAEMHRRMIDEGFNPMHMTGEDMIAGFNGIMERYRHIVNLLMGEAIKHRSGIDRTDLAALKQSRNSLFDYLISAHTKHVQAKHSAEGRGNS